MADYAARFADKSMDELRSRIQATFSQASSEVRQKMEDFAAKSKQRDAYMRQKVANGKMTQEQYRRWQQGQVFQGRQWEQRLKDVATAYTNADKAASSLISGTSQRVFVEAANYSAYHIEKAEERSIGASVSFNLYDEETVASLIAADPKVLPEWKINETKDYVWNEQRVRNAVAQGIIQGESVEGVAKRLTTELAAGNASHMNMLARTAITGAENAGRVSRMQEAEEMGIEVRKEWIATLDDRTRDTHADLDGQVVKVEESFQVAGMTIDYPGDPNAPPELVFNCRCTLGYVYPRHSGGHAVRYDQMAGEYVDDMSYREWEERKKNGGAGGEKLGGMAVESEESIKPRFTQKEKDALHEYTSSMYSAVNSSLREGTVEKYEAVNNIVEEIDSAMEKSVIAEGAEVSRGATMADLRGMFDGKKRSWFENPDNLKSLEGKTAVFDSYLSTTKGAVVSQAYERELQWHFVVGKGVHGIDMEPFASASASEVEREILFDRGSKIEILKVLVSTDEDGDINGIIEIIARITAR